MIYSYRQNMYNSKKAEIPKIIICYLHIYSRDSNLNYIEYSKETDLSWDS